MCKVLYLKIWLNGSMAVKMRHMVTLHCLSICVFKTAFVLVVSKASN